MFKRITERDIKAIKAIVADVKVGDEIDKEYAHDELGTVLAYPDMHVVVSTKQEISQVMAYAYQESIAVTVRGAGTGLVGACVPVEGGILLDTSKMNQIIELDKTNLTLTVEPGVLLLDIYEAVEKEGLFYAPDPGEKTATIGGNISTNAGGMRAVKYGVTRDWVRGLEVCLPNGELIKTGGKVVKNSTGYSIKDLIIGSEGTLGIIVEATLRLISKPKKTTSLLVPFENREQAIKAAPILIKDHVTPTAVEFLEKQSLQYSETFLGKKIPHNNFEAYLLLSYDGNSDSAVEADIEKASSMCLELGAIDCFLVDTSERAKTIWNVRGGFLEAIKASTDEIDEIDVVLPRAHISDYLAYVREVSEQMHMRIPYFGHIGDGNLHIYFCKDNMDESVWADKVKVGFNLLYQKAFSFGGLVSGEHGIGFAKKSYMVDLLGDTQITIMKGIKHVFDPKGILNPKKVI